MPYLINTADGTEIRILGNGDSPWHVEGDRQQGYRPGRRSQRTARVPIEFEPLRPWMTQKTHGRPAVRAGRRHHARRHARDQRRAGLRILPAQARRRVDALHVLRLRSARRTHDAASGQKAGSGRNSAADARAHARGTERGDRPDGDPPHLPRRRFAHRRAARKASASCSSRGS